MSQPTRITNWEEKKKINLLIEDINGGSLHEIAGNSCEENDVVDMLINSFAYLDGGKRKLSAKLLKKIGKDEWVNIFYGDKDDYTRLRSARGNDAIELLIKAIGTGLGEERLVVAKELNLLGETQWGELIKGDSDDIKRIMEVMLCSSDSRERKSCAYAIRMSEDSIIIDKIIEVLNCGEKNQRARAAEALGVIAGDKAVKALINVLRNLRLYTPILLDVVYSLGEIRDKRAVKPLLKALKNADEFVKPAAARALGELGDKAAVKPLINVLDGEIVLKSEAILALGKLKDERAIRPLTKLLKKKDNPADYSVEYALKEIRD